MASISRASCFVSWMAFSVVVGGACGPSAPAEDVAGTWTGRLGLTTGSAIDGVGEDPDVVVTIPAFEAAQTAVTLCADAPDIQLSLGTLELEIPNSSVCPDGVEQTVVQSDLVTVGSILLDLLRLEVALGSSEGSLEISITDLGSQNGAGDGDTGTYDGAVTRDP